MSFFKNSKNVPNWAILPQKKLFGPVNLGWNVSRNFWNLILSEILGLGTFLGWVGAKLAKWHLYQNCPNQTFANFAPSYPRKIPSPKISLKIKFRKVLDPFQPKMTRPNNFFWGKIDQFGPFLEFSLDFPGIRIFILGPSESPNVGLTWGI